MTAVIPCKSLLMENNYGRLRVDCNRFFTQRRKDVGPAVGLWRSNCISSSIPIKWGIFKDVTLAVTRSRTSCSRQWGVLFAFTSFRAVMCPAAFVCLPLILGVRVDDRFRFAQLFGTCYWGCCSHLGSVLYILAAACCPASASVRVLLQSDFCLAKWPAQD